MRPSIPEIKHWVNEHVELAPASGLNGYSPRQVIIQALDDLLLLVAAARAHEKASREATR